MPRNMSFAMTVGPFKDGSKGVTRRFGWWFLNPGDIVMGVEKAMGLKLGEKIKRLGLIRITGVHAEPLNSITQEEVILEGFPEMTPEEFVQMLVDHYKCDPGATVNVIYFRHIDHESIY